MTEPMVTAIDYTVEGGANGRTHRPSPWRSDLSEVQTERDLFANINPSAEWIIIRRVRTSTEEPWPTAVPDTRDKESR